MASASTYESTVWSSLIVTIGAGAYFFTKVFGAYAAGSPPGVGDLATLGLAVVVIIVAIEIAFNVALAIWCGGEPETDERDKLIAAKATRNAYYVLVTGVIMLIGHAGLAALFGYIDELRLDLPLAIVIGIFALVVAEVTHYASRLWYYRRGV